MLERTGGGEDGDANEVEHEQGDTLEIDDEDLAGEGGDSEECRSKEEDLDDENGEEGLEVGPEMIRTDAGVVCPRREGAEEGAEEHARKREDRGDEGSSPTSAEIGELGDGLGKEDLVGVTLEVAEDRGAEDGGNDDDAEERDEEVVESVGVGSIEKDLAIAVADGTEAFRRYAEKGEREPEDEVDVG